MLIASLHPLGEKVVNLMDMRSNLQKFESSIVDKDVTLHVTATDTNTRTGEEVLLCTDVTSATGSVISPLLKSVKQSQPSPVQVKYIKFY